MASHLRRRWQAAAAALLICSFVGFLAFRAEPADVKPPVSKRVAEIDAIASAFVKQGTPVQAIGWNTLDWVVFLRALPNTITLDRMQALDAQFMPQHFQPAQFFLAAMAIHRDDVAGQRISGFAPVLRQGFLHQAQSGIDAVFLVQQSHAVADCHLHRIQAIAAENRQMPHGHVDGGDFGILQLSIGHGGDHHGIDQGVLGRDGRHDGCFLGAGNPA